MWLTADDMVRTIREIVREETRKAIQEELSKPKERILSVKEACSVLSISAKTLSRMTKNREIRSLEGRRPMYEESEVQRVIQARRKY
jgi:excisionase family DNA binding protein